MESIVSAATADAPAVRITVVNDEVGGSMRLIGFALIAAAAAALIIWRAIALYNYGFHKRDL